MIRHCYQTLLLGNSSHRGSPVQSQEAISELARGWPLDSELAATVNVWKIIIKHTEVIRSHIVMMN